MYIYNAMQCYGMWYVMVWYVIVCMPIYMYICTYIYACFIIFFRNYIYIYMFLYTMYVYIARSMSVTLRMVINKELRCL